MLEALPSATGVATNSVVATTNLDLAELALTNSRPDYLVPPKVLEQVQLHVLSRADGTKCFFLAEAHGMSKSAKLLSVALHQLDPGEPVQFIIEGSNQKPLYKLRILPEVSGSSVIEAILKKQPDKCTFHLIPNIASPELLPEFIINAQKINPELDKQKVISWLAISAGILQTEASLQNLQELWKGEYSKQSIFDSISGYLKLPKQEQQELTNQMQGWIDTFNSRFKRDVSFTDLNDIKILTSIGREQDPQAEKHIVGILGSDYLDQTQSLQKFQRIAELGNQLKESYTELIENANKLSKIPEAQAYKLNSDLNFSLQTTQNAMAEQKLGDYLQKQTGAKQIIIVAGYMHSPGILAGLKKAGFQNK